MDGAGNIVYLQSASGTHSIVFSPVLLEVVQPALQALQNGASLEEINMIIAEGLTTVGESGNGLGGGSTEVTSDTESNGRIANKESFSNCECGNPVTRNFSASLLGVEDLDITFPPFATDTERAEATAIVRALLGISGADNQTVSLGVDLDKCSTASAVCSTEILRTATGTVNGFPFTFTGTDRLETTVETGDCPTTTPCHQGCPG